MKTKQRVVLAVSLAFIVIASLTACSDNRVTVCGGVEIVSPTLPDTATIKVGAATIAIAGVSYGSCGPPPARQYVWRISDSSVVTVDVIDSIHVWITGRRVGHAIVTPAYRSGGDPLGGVTLTVVP